MKNVSWVRNPIDRFVLSKLEEKGLTPSSAAGPRVVIRRAYFDLVGLPPPAEELKRGDYEAVSSTLKTTSVAPG